MSDECPCGNIWRGWNLWFWNIRHGTLWSEHEMHMPCRMQIMMREQEAYNMRRFISSVEGMIARVEKSLGAPS